MEIDKDEENFCETPEESESEYSSDDSENDPSYNIIDETHAKFSKLSIKKKTKARMVDDHDINLPGEAENDIVPPVLDEKDEKSFEEIQKMIGVDQLEKLKVDQCKVYLRRNGLRLTGNKGTLLQRIKEHLKISNGGGEKKYPVSSFSLNCKGDACTGDVVLFEQKVYDMFNIASRSASGPPCGTRIVAGRIVKESYGAAKQQHTFTIEVLWSKGEKPLPLLHPLLIKGRNLYRLKTLRQKWENEEERQKILSEKHSRGCLARSDREARIRVKEKRKMLKENRISVKEASKNQSQLDWTLVTKPSVQPWNFVASVNSENTEKQALEPQQSGFSADSGKPASKAQESGLTANFRKLASQPPAQNRDSYVYCVKVKTQSTLVKNATQDKYIDQASPNWAGSRSFTNSERLKSDIHELDPITLSDHRAPASTCSSMNWGEDLANRATHRQPLTSMNNYPPMIPSRKQNYVDNYRPTSPSRRQNCVDNYRPMSPSSRQNGMNYYRPTSPSRKQNCADNYRPMSPSRRHNCVDNYRPMSPLRRQNYMQQKLCRYYAQGRCYHGDKCKFSHDMREECGQRREERWPIDPREFQR
ncbi:Zinc finger CCCH-type domain containing protein [Parasponia andersonii]|uniref:Zinc finger CCCH-type domain containing protein n=1 Tax=Parasponia andersonii TaxID=3476 RepID=A0A2P5B470_PARAD|nr:Zinc finger CCCH-type domain containing protein [Parasponia andersonii]